MAMFLISCELPDPQAAAQVRAKMQELEALQVLDTVWVMDALWTAAMVRDAISPALGQDAGILVMELHYDAAWATLRCRDDGMDWLRRYITP